ncbi:MAG TPA: chemotaxis protein CheB [Ruminiclostridium sp.]
MMNKKEKADKHAEFFLAEEPNNITETEMPEVDFPIIGIGASAGGLEALELFLRNVPEKSGMAFIVVQHLNPTRKSIMVELLHSVTAMTVLLVKENTSVQPNCVYIIPPKMDMSLFHGVSHLLEPVAARGHRLPIDCLFCTMADDLRKLAIGVILSGMGSDGTQGLKAIKEKGGVVFVQEPVSAQFDSMPKSAINTGLVDIVAPAVEPPLKIIFYLKHKPVISGLKPDLVGKDYCDFEKIVILLRSQTGHDFSSYNKAIVYCRIERRMGIHKIDELVTYVRFLQDNPQELQVLFKELLIGVTSFFRDTEEWERLKEQTIPELFTGCTPHHPLRAWVAGCSTGEEAYSLAIIFKEALEHTKPTANLSLQIFATDLDNDAIGKARKGFYTANIEAHVSPERLRRFFIKEENGYRVGKEIRDMVVFAHQNIIMDPPFTKIDILTCRNLLIYLTPELQKKLMLLFHHSLNPGGVLFLGSAETIGVLTDRFKPLESKSRLYMRMETTWQKELFEFHHSKYCSPSGVWNADISLPKACDHTPNLENLANQLILQRYSPAAVLVSDKGDILYTSGRIGKYLELTAGKANWNIFAMIPAGLCYKLNRSFQKAVQQNSTITLKKVKIDTDDKTQNIDIIIQPLTEPEELRRLLMIVFIELRIPTKTSGSNRHISTHINCIEELELELEESLQKLKTVREEKQSSQEELIAAHEELQSMNEELQSTNEEITISMKESQTVNYQLKTKVNELSQVNNEMKNLLENTQIATLFMDNALCVRRFTARTVKIIKLISADVGRPITDITTKLAYPEMIKDAQEVLRTLSFAEKAVTTSEGLWFAVRIMPYRTLESKIDGLVITFTDITAFKELESKLNQTQTGLEERITNKVIEKNKLKSEIQQNYKGKRSSKTRKSGKTTEV